MRAVARARPAAAARTSAHAFGMGQPLGAFLPRVAEPSDHGLGQPRFHLAVADPAFAISPLDFRELAAGGKQPVQVEERASVGVLGSLDGRAVGDDLLDLFLDGRRVVEDVDRVVVALGHLAAVQARDHRHRLENVRLGQPEHVFPAAVDPVEPLGDVASDFEVLLLVLAHRHQVGVVEQDVGGLKNRVGEKPVLGGQALLNLVLVAHAFFQPAHRRHGREQPRQLGRLRDVRLNEQGRLLRVEAQRQHRDDHVERVLAKLPGILDAGRARDNRRRSSRRRCRSEDR